MNFGAMKTGGANNRSNVGIFGCANSPDSTDKLPRTVEKPSDDPAQQIQRTSTCCQATDRNDPLQLLL